MRRPQPGPYERRRIEIPPALRDSLREVWELIQQAARDPDFPLDYDDAIQVGAVRGGRIGERSRPYVLSFVPTGDGERGRWSLTLHPTEIEDIADGRTTEIAMYCCSSPECRRKFREAEGRCGDCDDRADPGYAHLALGAALPRLEGMGVAGLTLTANRVDVLAALGPPPESGGGVRDPSLGYVKPWIKYYLPGWQLRFEFGRRGAVEAVTFLPEGWRPGE
jgi:hypothetical protein